jgi:hypothetical protein
MQCRICASTADPFGQAVILAKFKVQYFRCPVCCFVQTEEPFWLNEAYSVAIASLDVGIMNRNLHNADLTAAMISLLFPSSSRYLDFAGGHGTLVRMMRDRGFDFRWCDRFAENKFARGFEHVEGQQYDLVTAYEVLEHFAHPSEEFESLLGFGKNLLVSTLPLPEPPPEPPNWWYYAVSTGQHVGFYSRRTLSWLAGRFGLKLLTHGEHHLFSRSAKNAVLFRLAVSGKTAPAIGSVLKRKSLTPDDFIRMSETASR